MEDWQIQAIAYIIGSLSGFIIASRFLRERENRLLDLLIDEGFLKHRIDDNGNVIIVKYRDNL